MPRIRDSADVFGERGADAVLRRLARRGVALPDVVRGAPVGPPATARVDAGRWLAGCGLDDPIRSRVCPNAQLLDRHDSRIWCVVCHNRALGFRWRQVAWPADRAAIEAALEPLDVAAQHWAPPGPGKHGPDPDPPIFAPD